MVKKKKPEKHYVTYTFVAAIIFFVLFILSTIKTGSFILTSQNPVSTLEVIGLFATADWFLVSFIAVIGCLGWAIDEFDES